MNIKYYKQSKFLLNTIVLLHKWQIAESVGTPTSEILEVPGHSQWLCMWMWFCNWVANIVTIVIKYIFFFFFLCGMHH